MYSQGKKLFSGRAALAAALATAGTAAALLAPASASACPDAAYCTDSNGTYTINYGPLPTSGFLAPYRDCVWDVHVDFGDGSVGDYVYEGEVGVSGSHTFPPYGQYTVKFTIYNGEHTKSTGTCPSLQETKSVYYQSPAEIQAEEEAKALKAKEAQEAKERKEKEAQEAKEAKERKEKEAKEAKEAKEKGKSGSGGNSPGGGGSGEEGGKGTTQPTLRWHTCGHEIIVRLVKCSKGREVISRAQDKLGERRAARVAGFSCHLIDGGQQISCRRARSRVLGRTD